MIFLKSLPEAHSTISRMPLFHKFSYLLISQLPAFLDEAYVVTAAIIMYRRVHRRQISECQNLVAGCRKVEATTALGMRGRKMRLEQGEGRSASEGRPHSSRRRPLLPRLRSACPPARPVPARSDRSLPAPRA